MPLSRGEGRGKRREGEGLRYGCWGRWTPLSNGHAYRSLFYGYANGDILFDVGLPTTLLEISDDVERYSELLITGVRTDCFIDADTDCDAHASLTSSTLDRFRTAGALIAVGFSLFLCSRKGHISMSIGGIGVSAGVLKLTVKWASMLK